MGARLLCAAARDLFVLPFHCAFHCNTPSTAVEVAFHCDSSHAMWRFPSAWRRSLRTSFSRPRFVTCRVAFSCGFASVITYYYAFFTRHVLCAGIFSPFTIAGFWEMNGFAVTRVAFTKQYSGGSRGAVNELGSTGQHTRVEYRGQVSPLPCTM